MNEELLVSYTQTDGTEKFITVKAKTKNEFSAILKGMALALNIDVTDITISPFSLRHKWFKEV